MAPSGSRDAGCPRPARRGGASAGSRPFRKSGERERVPVATVRRRATASEVRSRRAASTRRRPRSHHRRRTPHLASPPLRHVTDHDPLSLVSVVLLVLHLDRSRLLPPRPQPLHITPGLPARFIWHVEEGGSSAKRWTPLPRKPRRDALCRPAAGRRPVRLLRRTTRDEHLETNTQRRTTRGPVTDAGRRAYGGSNPNAHARRALRRWDGGRGGRQVRSPGELPPGAARRPTHRGARPRGRTRLSRAGCVAGAFRAAPPAPLGDLRPEGSRTWALAA